MYLARFQLDEVPDGECGDAAVPDKRSEQKQPSPNNTTYINWEQSSR